MEDCMQELIEISREGDVLKFTINNIENGNEITGTMFDKMIDVLKKETENPSVKVLHIRAKGGQFCTGRERAGRTTVEIRKESEKLIKFKQMLREIPVITIAEVQGDAQGFGFGMAIVCDFVIASRSAVLGFPEMKMGLAPVAIMSYLGEYIHPRHAFQLVLTGEPISPDKAAEIGLINEAVAPDQLSATVNKLIESILLLDANALRNCKEFFHTAMKNSFYQNIRLSVDALTLGSLAILQKQK